MRKQSWLLTLALIALLAVLAACGDDNGNGDDVEDEIEQIATEVESEIEEAATEVGPELEEAATEVESGLEEAATEVGEEIDDLDATAEADLGAAAESGMAEVALRNTAFQPNEITIPAGTTVRWTNEDTVLHTVDSGTRDAPTTDFTSGDLEQGGTFEHTFDTPGTYPYFCAIHPGMEGVITVE